MVDSILLENAATAHQRTLYCPLIPGFLEIRLGIVVAKSFVQVKPLRLFYAALLLGYALMLGNTLRLDTSWAQDFTAFYTGWTTALSKDGSSLYDFETQRRHQSEILSRDGWDSSRIQNGLLPYLNPPHVTALFAPFALLDRRNALMTWVVIQIALMFVFWRLMREVDALLVFAAMPLVLMAIGIGALSLLVTLAIWKAYEAFKDGRDTHAAIWVALATIKPQMCLLPIVGLMVVRPRLLIKLLLALLPLTAASLLLVGIKPFLDYPGLLQTVSNMAGQYSLLIATNSTLRGLLFLMFGYEHVGPINAISGAALIAVIGLTVYLWRSSDDMALKIAATVLLGLFFGLHVNPVDDVLLVVPAFILYKRSRLLAWFLAFVPVLLLIEWKFVLGFRPCSPVIYALIIALSYRTVKEIRESRGERICAQEFDTSSRVYS